MIGLLRREDSYLDSKCLSQFKGRSVRQCLDQNGNMAKGVEGTVVRNRVQGNKLVCVLLACEVKQNSNEAYVLKYKKRDSDEYI